MSVAVFVLCDTCGRVETCPHKIVVGAASYSFVCPKCGRMMTRHRDFPAEILEWDRHLPRLSVGEVAEFTAQLDMFDDVSDLAAAEPSG